MRRRNNRIRDVVAQMFREGFVVVDTETTGLSKTDEVIQVGLVNHENYAMFGDWMSPFRAKVSPDAAMIHGRRQKVVEGLPGLDFFWKHIKSCMEGKRVFAYNAPFDKRLLEQSAGPRDLEMPAVKGWHCAMSAAKQYLYKGKYLSLACACEELGVVYEPEKLHDAIEDCRYTVAMLKAIAEGK